MHEKETGRGERIRTSGLFVPNEVDTAQKSPETLGETDPPQNDVTQNVTSDAENVTLSDLAGLLRTLPKEDIIRLLGEALKDR